MAGALAALLSALSPPEIRAADAPVSSTLFNAEGYRIARYRAPLPARPPAGRRIDTAALAAMLERQAPLLIDVQAVTVRPETAEFGVAWLPTGQRYNLPGSVWLPNVGYGRLDARMAAYLDDNLQRLTAGDPDRPIVFYCVVDCWMSWNAVKRAAALGYRNLYWYPEGTDGWQEAGLPLQVGHPQPLSTGPPAGGCPDFFGCAPDDLPAALDRVAEQPGLTAVLLFFETADCPYCQRMRRGLLRDPEIIAYFHQRFVVMPVDLESDASWRDARRMPTTQAAFAAGLQIHRTPTLVFLNADGEELYRHAGIVVDPRVFRRLADYVSQGRFEQIGFREFLGSAGGRSARPAVPEQ